MMAGDRVVWRPTWDASGDREGVVLVAPGGQVSTPTGYMTVGPSAVVVQFDDVIDGHDTYIIGTHNVQVIS